MKQLSAIELFKERLSKPLVMDGAMGTQLQALGYDVNTKLWSAKALLDAPNLVQTVHEQSLQAGAKLIITNTYQANLAALMQAKLSQKAALAAIKSGVTLADAARQKINPTAIVAASVGPLGAFLADGSEYSGNYHRTCAQFQAFHRPRLEAILAGKPDCLLFETQCRIDEVQALLDLTAKIAPQMPVIVSFVLAANELTLPDGTPLPTAASTVSRYGQVVAVGVNCVPYVRISAALRTLNHCSKPVVVYPNMGAVYDPTIKQWSKPESVDFQTLITKWLALGARIIGGCCTTTPKDIATIAAVVRRES